MSNGYYTPETCPECGIAPNEGARNHTDGCRTGWARMRAHELLDALWQGGPLKRPQAYILVQDVLGLSRDRAHIGLMGKEACHKLILALKDLDPDEWLKGYSERKAAARAKDEESKRASKARKRGRKAKALSAQAARLREKGMDTILLQSRILKMLEPGTEYAQPALLDMCLAGTESLPNARLDEVRHAIGALVNRGDLHITLDWKLRLPEPEVASGPYDLEDWLRLSKHIIPKLKGAAKNPGAEDYMAELTEARDWLSRIVDKHPISCYCGAPSCDRCRGLDA